MTDNKKLENILNGLTSDESLLAIIFEVKEKESNCTRLELLESLKHEIKLLELYK